MLGFKVALQGNDVIHVRPTQLVRPARVFLTYALRDSVSNMSSKGRNLFLSHRGNWGNKLNHFPSTTQAAFSEQDPGHGRSQGINPQLPIKFFEIANAEVLSSSQLQQYFGQTPRVHVRQIVLSLVQAEEARGSCAAVYHRSSLSFPITCWPLPRSVLPQPIPVPDGVQVLLVLQRKGVGHVGLLQAP